MTARSAQGFDSIVECFSSVALTSLSAADLDASLILGLPPLKTQSLYVNSRITRSVLFGTSSGTHAEVYPDVVAGMARFSNVWFASGNVSSIQVNTRDNQPFSGS